MGFSFWRESGLILLKKLTAVSLALLVMLFSFGGVAQEDEVVGPMGDYGDAPDGVSAEFRNLDPEMDAAYPSVFADPDQIDYVVHLSPLDRAFLGLFVTEETNARITDLDEFDDGWINGSMATCAFNEIEVFITVPEEATAGPLYLNLLFDWDHNGIWADFAICPSETRGFLQAPEWAVRNLALHEAPYNLSPGFQGNVLLPVFVSGPQLGELWGRFTISTEPVDESVFVPVELGGSGWNGSGIFTFGETEDYPTCLVEDEDNAGLLIGCPSGAVREFPLDLPPDNRGSVTVIKEVINDDGGTSKPEDFTMVVTGSEVTQGTFPGSEEGVIVRLLEGTYAVNEVSVPGYEASFSEDCFGGILPGQELICRVTNDDIAPKVIVITQVTNDNGGSLSPSDATISFAGNNASITDFSGSSDGTEITLTAGSYNVDHPSLPGYSLDRSPECEGDAEIGEVIVCTLSYNDIAPEVNVTVDVTNDNGGGADPGDFTITISGPGVPGGSITFPGDGGGTNVPLNSGDYTITVNGPNGYEETLSDDCVGSLDIGETADCAISLDDIAPTLTIITNVINDSDTPGSGSPGDFTLDVTGGGIPGGTTDVTGNSGGSDVPGVEVGSYNISEDSGPDNYNVDFSSECTGNLSLGEDVICVVTFDDNFPPDAVDDEFNVDEDSGSTSLDVLGNDSDPDATSDGDTFSITTFTQPKDGGGNVQGTVDCSSGTECTYTPPADFNGTVTFEYTITDDHGNTDTATVTIVVDPVNDPPVAQDDNFTTLEDENVNGNVLSDNGSGPDTDPDGDDLEVTTSLVDGPDNGSVTINPDGTFEYEPDDNFNGTDTFTYEVCDNGTPQICDEATVTIDVGLVNDRPDARNDAFETDEEEPVSGNVIPDNGNGADEDVDGDPLTVTLTDDVDNGTLTLNEDGSFTYTPDENFEGTDSFEYEICDNGTPPLCDTATVTITVNGINDRPVAVGETATVAEGGSVSVLNSSDTSILDNDTDIEGPVSLDSYTVNGSVGIIGTPVGVANGTLTLNTNGTFTFTHDGSENHDDVVVNYVIEDLDGAQESATFTINVTPVNDPPTANNDSYSTDEDTTLTVPAGSGVLENDTDPEDDTLSVVEVNGNPASVNNPITLTNGTLTVNSDGSLTYVPFDDVSGVETFTYVANDGNLDSNEATVTLTINPVNDPPVAENDAINTNEDTSTGGSVFSDNGSGSDSDPEGDSFSVVEVNGSSSNVGNQITLPSGSKVTINSNGTFSYEPAENFFGSESVTYLIEDTSGDSDPVLSQATVTFIVAPQNDPPVANNDSYNTDEDTPLTISAPGILDNDDDVEGDGLSVALINGGAATVGSSFDVGNGTITVQGNGSLTYTPDPNFSGTDSFTYQANDGAANSNTATVVIVVDPVNDPPVAQDDSFTTLEDTPITVASGANILANNGAGADSDPDIGLVIGEAIAVTQINGAPVVGTTVALSKGELKVTASGGLTYTPNENEFGVETFTYQICDNGIPQECDTATVTINITEENDPPVANDDSASTEEDESVDVDVVANDTDVDGTVDPTSVTITDDADNGSTSVNPTTGVVTYTPDPDFNGTDTFEYQVCDDDGDCDTATVTITVDAGPDAADDEIDTEEDTPVSGDVSTNDDEGDTPATYSVETGPSNGTITEFNNDGTFTYEPNPDFNGIDSFTYEVCDDDGDCDTATVTITVDAGPDAVDDEFSTDEDTPVSGDVSTNDDEGDTPATYSVDVDPSFGTLTSFNSDGTFTYEPNADFNGTDNFTYIVTDADGDTSTATVTITVNDVNDPPVANDDSAGTNEDESVDIDVPENDTDVDGTVDPTSVTITAEPDNGSTSVNPTTGVVTYSPDENFNGIDTFEYQICDDDGDCDTATVTVDVGGVNDPPVANDDSANTEEDSAVDVDVTDNDTDVDGTIDPTSVVVTSGPDNGSTDVNPTTGVVTYTPDPDFNGTDTFEYQVCDNEGACDTATVTVTVDANPDAVDDNFDTEEDTAVNGDVSTNDDEGDTPATYTQGTGPSDGSLTFNNNGTFTYTPDTDFNGTDSFTYTVTDADGDTDTATVTITVDAGPDAVDDSFDTEEDTAVSGDVSTNDDEGDTPATYTVDSSPSNGTLNSFDSDGQFTYTPDPDFNGTDTFTYEVCDADGDCDTATVTINVEAGPDAVDDSFDTEEDTAVSGDVSTNDDEGDTPATYTVDSNPSDGTLTSFNNDGTFTYEPDPDFTGTDTFTYTVTDVDGDTSTATVTINVDENPDAFNDTFGTDEDTDVSGDVSSNDDEGDAPATYAVNTGPSNGSLTSFNNDGTFTYSPNENFSGTDTFTYTITDADGDTDTATVTIIVDAVPDAVDDAVSTEEDTSVNGDVSANDDEGDSPATYAQDSLPSNGTVTSFGSNGTFTYAPNAGFNGTDTFTYIITDFNGDTDTATVTITVDAGPDAFDDSVSTEEDTAVNGDVSTNDDEGDTPATYAVNGGPSNGTLTSFNNDGTFTYTPNADFNGTDTFTYTITDADGDTDTATVTITVDAGPDAVDDNFNTEEDSAVGGDVSTNDDEGDTPATYAVNTGPSNGTITSFNSDGTFIYTPNADFNGTDTFTYTITDADGDTDTATVTITVDAGPDAVDDNFNTEEDSAVGGDVSTNDDEGDTPASYAVNTGPSSGTLTSFNSDGTFTYAPGIDFHGTDSFTYTITDADGDTDTATVTITVDSNPDAQNDFFNTEEDTAVNGNVSTNDDKGNSPATFAVNTNPSNGTLTSFNTDGTFIYTPNADFNGIDTFTYTITDADGDTDTATVQIIVDEGPDAVNDSATTNEDTNVSGDVSTNDDEGDTPATYTVLTNPSNGTLPTFNADGTFTYSPNTNFNGVDTFTYTITDADGDTDTATVTITVNDVNDPPVANDDSASTDEDVAVDIDVPSNDTDVDGTIDRTSVTITDPADNGSTSINPTTGVVTYTPATNFNGTDTFEYQICDDDGACDTATVTIDVGGVNDPPVANDDSASTEEDTPVDVDVTDNDTDVDGTIDPTTVTITDDADNGSTSVDPVTGVVTYTPDPDFNGTDTFEYQVCDDGGLCDTATVTITVDAGPDAVNDNFDTEEDTAVNGDVSTNDDEGDTPATYAVNTGPSNGTLTSFNNDGTFTYTPNADFNGNDTFTYTITDADGDTDTATVTIAVDANPDAVDDSVNTEEDTAVNGDVSTNDDEGDTPATYAVNGGPSNGTLTSFNNDGTFTYTPNADFNGTDTFTYTITDADGDTDTATVTITVDAGPDAVDDNFNTEEDSAVGGDVSTNDDEGDTPATYAVNTGPSNGTITSFNGDGTFVYTPNADFNGNDSFTYTITDADGDSDTATVTITVDAGPDAVDDAVSTEEDTAVGGDVSSNDDEGDTPATYAVNTSPSNGTLTSFNSDGTFVYTPNADFNGNDSFTYTITDADGDTDTATVTITVDAGPDAVDDNFNTEEETAVNGDVSTNDDEGDTPATYNQLSNPSNGTVTSFNSDGTFSYTPNANFSGNDTFTYTITDADGDTDTATVTITVDANPDAVDDNFNTEEDTAVGGDVSSNDDEGDTPATYAVNSGPSNGTLTSFNNDGTFVYTPNADFNGVDTFTYTVTDADGDTDTATVTITVDAGPDAVDDNFNTEEDTAVGGDVSSNDDEGDAPATYAVSSGPSNGTLTSFNNDGTFVYTPNADFNGVDTLTYTVTDADGDTDTATVTITVDANPDAVNDNFNTEEDTAVGGDVSTNDDEGDTPATYAVNSGPSNGTLTSFNSDGTFVYTPNADFNGIDTFTYTVTDADGDTDTATVTITVDANPDAFDDSETTNEDTPVSGDVSTNDDEGDLPATYAVNSGPSNGTLTAFNIDGTFTYKPNTNFNGVDTFTYTITDADGDTDTATVTITVIDVNDPPVANDDSAFTNEDTPVDINVPSNDTDIDGTIDTTSVVITDPADNGSTAINGVTGVVTYTPNTNYHGVDSFEYRICDDDGACDTAIVTITIGDDNDPPVANDDAASTEEDTPVNVDVTANDTDVDGTIDTTTVTITDDADNGSTSVNPVTGVVTYTPDPDFNGVDTFVYQVCDDDGDCDTATVTITVDAGPDAVDDAFNTEEDTAVGGDVSTNDDEGNTPATYAMNTGPSNGTITSFNSDGTFVYTPNADFNGNDTFTYTITDADGDTDTATVTITVDAGPDAVDDAYSTEEDAPVTTGDVLANDDLGDEPTTITAFDSASTQGGTVSNNGNGTFDYTPPADFNGTDTFTYTITDADGDTDTATVTITVDAGPDAVDDAFNTEEDTAVGGDVSTNDDEGDTPATYAVNTGPSNGTITSFNSDGTFVYTPNADFNGVDTFTYTITDADGDTDTATVTITVDAGPDAVDDAFNTEEDTAVGGDVSTNDDEGDTPATYAVNSGPSSGTLTSFNSDGTFVYTPNADFNGVDTFTYTITDADGDTDTATVTITVDAGPDAVDDAFSTEEDTAVGGDVSTNDDEGDTPATYAVNTGPLNGTITSFNSDGTFVYTPNADFSGVDTFTYTITDADGDTDTATVTITVDAGPDAVDDNFNTEEDTAVGGDVSTNDDEGDTPATYSVNTGPSSGTITSFNSDGTFVYTPNANFSGVDTFTYTITDADGDTDTATVTITVDANPDAQDDAESTDEDTPVSGDVSTNDDEGDAPATYAVNTGPSNGTLTAFNNDGTFTYTPNTNFNGVDTFTYTITDADGDTDTATVTINVADVNDPPIANNDSETTNEDTPVDVNVPSNDTDVDGTIDTTSVVILDDADNGTTNVNGVTGVVTYTPNTNFNGIDTFTYQICDDDGACDTALVTITVGDVNDPPVANDDAASTEEDTPVNIDVTANDTDVDGTIDPTSVVITSPASNGGTSVSPVTGVVTYTPDPDFNGVDTFMYQVCDDDGACDTATVTITVDAGPDAVDDAFNTEEDTAVGGDVSTNDDEGDTPATYAVNTGPSNGTITSFNSDGTFVYTPNADFNGVDAFTYTITDADGDTDTATVTITVDAGPDAVDDNFNTEEDTAVGGDVSTNDDEGDTPATYAVNTGPSNGTITSFNSDGTFVYAPNADFNGVDTFTYTITDADGDTDTATVTITVDAGPDAVDDNYNTNEDTALNGDVSTNDDEGSTPATYTQTSSPSNGTITSFNSDGTFTYQPSADFSGSDSFTYLITDADGDTDTATVFITVDPVNDPPDAVNDPNGSTGGQRIEVEETQNVIISVLTNDSDPENDMLTITTPMPTATFGTVNCTSSVCTYSVGSLGLAPGTTQTDQFDYTITDGNGGFDTATVFIEITAKDEGVEANNDIYVIDLNAETFINFDVFPNDIDFDNPPGQETDTLTITSHTQPQFGTVVCSTTQGDGSCTYTYTLGTAPPLDQDSFQYFIIDDEGSTASATVVIDFLEVDETLIRWWDGSEDGGQSSAFFQDDVFEVHVFDDSSGVEVVTIVGFGSARKAFPNEFGADLLPGVYDFQFCWVEELAVDSDGDGQLNDQGLLGVLSFELVDRNGNNIPGVLGDSGPFPDVGGVPPQIGGYQQCATYQDFVIP